MYWELALISNPQDSDRWLAPGRGFRHVLYLERLWILRSCTVGVLDRATTVIGFLVGSRHKLT
jgi:hypothetical protein